VDIVEIGDLRFTRDCYGWEPNKKLRKFRKYKFIFKEIRFNQMPKIKMKSHEKPIIPNSISSCTNVGKLVLPHSAAGG
jgi:hypothetical protein